jgi:hypothetical protein
MLATFADVPPIRRSRRTSAERIGGRGRSLDDEELNERSRSSGKLRGRFGLGTLGTQNQEVGPHRALREPVAAEDRVLR